MVMTMSDKDYIEKLQEELAMKQTELDDITAERDELRLAIENFWNEMSVVSTIRKMFKFGSVDGPKWF